MWRARAQDSAYFQAERLMIRRKVKFISSPTCHFDFRFGA
jgi:hypothetical protein